MRGPGTIRAHLREATRQAHEALHAHHLFSRLLAPDLSPAELRAATRANQRAFAELEAARATAGLWPDLSLRATLERMAEDLGATATAPPSALAFTSPAQILGGLYVAHGSAFGARQIGRHLRQVLPDAPARYYSEGPNDAWPKLCARLETLEGAAVNDALTGAAAMFALVHQCADEAEADLGSLAA